MDRERETGQGMRKRREEGEEEVMKTLEGGHGGRGKRKNRTSKIGTTKGNWNGTKEGGQSKDIECIKRIKEKKCRISKAILRTTQDQEWKTENEEEEERGRGGTKNKGRTQDKTKQILKRREKGQVA